MSKKLKLIISALISMHLLQGCSIIDKKNDEKEENQQVEDKNTKLKKKRFKFNTDEKAQDYVEKKGGLIFGKKQEYEFSERNLIWRASLEALSELPILSASYSGGIISTDWYGNSNKQVRINVVFNSKNISPSSLKIKSFIKNCNLSAECNISNGSEKFNSQIKDKIISQVQKLKIEENK